MKVLFVRNYLHKELVNKTPITIHENDDIQEIYDINNLYGESLLVKLFNDNVTQQTYDYVVLIDEDCKIYDSNVIYEIINYMEDNDIDMIGPSDGTMFNTWMRIHRDDLPNLFFTVLKTKKMIIGEDIKDWKIPTYHPKPSSSTFEGYYKSLTYYIYHLNMVYEPLKKYENKSEGIFTKILWKDKEFGIHTWYSRLYGKIYSIQNVLMHC